MEAHLDRCYVAADNLKSSLPESILNMEGMTGKKTRHFYNNLLTMDGARYLEIGTWKGSSVCSAMYNNKATVLCIDNWSQFGGPKDEFLKNLELYRGANDAKYIESDCWKVDVKSIGKFNIYLYDGDHTFEDHYNALTYYIECLDDTFIFIVDDWNWNGVREATMKSIQDLGLQEKHRIEVRLTNDGSHTADMNLARETWHNGISAFVLQKRGD